MTTTGLATLGGNVSTSAGQTYNSTELKANIVLADSGASTISTGNVTGNANDLTINTTGATILGTVDNVDALVTNAGGTTSFTAITNGGSVDFGDDVTVNGNLTTSGSQTFKDGVTLTARLHHLHR